MKREEEEKGRAETELAKCIFFFYRDAPVMENILFSGSFKKHTKFNVLYDISSFEMKEISESI